MKIPTMLLHRVLIDMGLQMIDTIDNDYRVICSRYEKEGMSFLTITLPTLDDALLKGLSRGRLQRDDFRGFSSLGRNGSLPKLLSGFFKRVFHIDGSIKDEPDICAIVAIRQVTRLFKKVELPCSSPRINEAYKRYQSNDREVDWRCHNESLNIPLWRSVCGLLWSDLEDISESLYCAPGIFGSGATAEGYRRNSRNSISEWPVRSENSFPMAYHAVPREDRDLLAGISEIPVEHERPVRVVQVPKTLKTPRTISVEPSYMMLMQQSIAKPLMVYLESKRFGFQSIRFVDQSVNNKLARLGSIDGSYATIDLKDASDLVDLDLVRDIFRGPCPTFLRLIEDCRSTRAQMPDSTIVSLRKFASMGSAMCFPIESMVFFTIVLYALVKVQGRVPSRRLLLSLAKDVAIYGDDIIVKSSMAPVVMETLTNFGLKVNHDKSFHTGLFRESCGGDYYNGVNVTPAYVRQWDDTGTLSQASLKVAYVSLSNTLYMKGLWHACQYLRDEFAKLHFGKNLPLSQHPIGVLHYASFVRSSQLCYSTRSSGYFVKGYSVRSAKLADSPINLSGNLILAFQPEYFQERLQEFKASVSTATRERSYGGHLQKWEIHRTSKFDEYHNGVHGMVPGSCFTSGPKQPRLFVVGSQTGSQSSNDFQLLRTPPSESYGEILSKGFGDAHLGRRLAHLKMPSYSSLGTSDKPHALSLKRARTASPAGLHW